MKFKKSVRIEYGSNEFIMMGVSDCESFEDCDRELQKGAKSISRFAEDKIKIMLGRREVA